MIIFRIFRLGVWIIFGLRFQGKCVLTLLSLSLVQTLQERKYVCESQGKFWFYVEDEQANIAELQKKAKKSVKLQFLSKSLSQEKRRQFELTFKIVNNKTQKC